MIPTTICRSYPNEGRTRYLKTQKTITNKRAIDFEKKPHQPKFVIMDWDISTSHKENALCREKGLELRAIYNPLLGLSNNEAYHFLYFFISNFKICFCFKLWIIYISLWSVLVLIISNKNIEKLELTKCPTQRDLKISQVEDVQFCCSGVTCKNK